VSGEVQGEVGAGGDFLAQDSSPFATVGEHPGTCGQVILPAELVGLSYSAAESIDGGASKEFTCAKVECGVYHKSLLCMYGVGRHPDLQEYYNINLTENQ
jgi:hypothetical protein